MPFTRLSGKLIRSGSIPTGSIENFRGAVTASLPTGTVSSSAQINTGSFTGSFTGQFIGTSSWATTASIAITASYTLPSGLPTGVISSSAQVTASISGSTITPSLISQSNFDGYAVTTHRYLELYPTDTNISGDPNSAYFYISGSKNDLWYTHKQDSTVNFDWIEGVLETGLLHGGISGFNGTEVHIRSGSGIIVTHGATVGAAPSPTINYVTWPAITGSIDVTNGYVTYLSINAAGQLVSSSTRFTSAEYHDSIPLGAVGHFNQVAIAAKGEQINTQYSAFAQLADFTRTFGPIKVSGFGITPQTSSLKFSRAAGNSFIYGGFYSQNPETPSNYQSTSVNTGSLAYIFRTGSALGYSVDANNNNFYTDVKPGFYDTGNGTASLASNEWSIQRVFIEPVTGIHYIYYGQSKYTSLANAVANILTDPFTEGPATSLFTVFAAYLIMKGDTVNLADTGSNSVLSAGLFRNTSAGSVGGGAAAQLLNDLSDVDVITPSNGQGLVYSSGLWINGTPLNATSASYVQPSGLPSGIVSSSTQINTGSFSGSFTGTLIGTSSWANSASLALTASYAANASSDWNAITNKPSGLVSSSTQINTGSFTGSFTGILIGTSSIATTASYAATSSYISGYLDLSSGLEITGSLVVTGSQTTIGNTVITGSLTLSSSAATELLVVGNSIMSGALNVTSGITGSLFGTSSWATSASLALTASYAANASSDWNTITNKPTGLVSSSIQINTGSFSGSFTGTLIGTSSWATSASIAITASYVLPTGLPSGVVSSSTQINTGSFTGSFTGQFIGTSSWANSASVAITSSYVLPTGLPNGIVSSSTQFTSLTAPFTGSFTGSFTGTLIGTSSWATSASFATTSSFAISASWAPGGAGTVGPGTTNTIARFTTSTTIGDSGLIDDGTIISSSRAISGSSFTGSFFGTSALISGSGTVLQVSGSASIRDNFTVNGSSLFVDAANNRVGINTLAPTTALQVLGTVSSSDATASGVFITNGTQIATFRAGNPVLFGTVSSTNLSLIIGNTIRYTFGTAGLTFSANNTYDIGTSANRAATIYATQLLSTGITGSIISASTALTASTIQIPPAGITDTTATNKVLVLDTATGQFFTTASVIPNGVVSSSTQFTSLTAPFTGSFTGSFTGRLIGTSSVATSASYALTASYAANAGTSGLTTKAGSIANTAFTGNPRKAPVNFSTPFATTNYAIVITGEDARSWNVEGKVVGGFTASSNSNTGLTGTTYWIATAYGET